MVDRRMVVCALLLAGCTPAADDGSGNVQGAVPAEANAALSSSEQVAGPDYYPAGYAEMKTAAAIFAKENFGAFDTGEGAVYSIEDCQGSYESAEINTAGDPKQLQLEAFAREVAKHQHYLSQLYAPAVFEGPLRDYERNSIEHLMQMPPPPDYGDPQRPENPRYDAWESQGWKLKEALTEAMEERRQRLDPGKIPINVGGECGAGETPYLVKTEPSNGRFWVTTKFSFDLCRARKLDPWNTDACRWTELSPSEPAYLSGRYVYQAKWRNGDQRRGVRAFDGAVSTDDGEAAEVVIRPL